VVIPRYNQKGPEIRDKLICCAHCIHFPQYLPLDRGARCGIVATNRQVAGSIPNGVTGILH
jgi:hypothetical protein